MWGPLLMSNRFFVIALLALAVWKQSSAQLVHGTIIAFSISQNQIVIGADSRESTGGRRHADDVCKIVVLDDKAIFLALNLSRQSTAQDGISAWDSAQLAREEWKTVNGATANVNREFLHTLTDNWGNRLAAIANKYVETYGSDEVAQMPNGGKIGGLFFVRDNNGHLEAANVIVGYVPRGKSLVAKVFSEPIDPPNAGYIIGVTPSTDVSKEFVNDDMQLSPRTERSKKAVQKWALDRLAMEDQQIQVVEHLINASFQLLPIQELAGIGKPVDVVEFKANAGLRWIHRKPNCVGK